MSNTDNTSDDNIDSSTTNVWSTNENLDNWNYPDNNETGWNNNNFNQLILAINNPSLTIDYSNNNTNIIIPYPNSYLSENYENRIINSVINESFYDKNPIKNVISDEGIKCIKFSKWNNNHYLKSCPIFLNEFKENDEIATLPCNHCFSKDAVMHWLTNENNSCPTCRYPLKSIEKKTEDNQYQMSPTQTFRNTPEAPSVFDFILNRLEDHIEQRQIERIILQSLSNEYYNDDINNENNNQNNNLNSESSIPDLMNEEEEKEEDYISDDEIDINMI